MQSRSHFFLPPIKKPNDFQSNSALFAKYGGKSKENESKLKDNAREMLKNYEEKDEKGFKQREKPRVLLKFRRPFLKQDKLRDLLDNNNNQVYTKPLLYLPNIASNYIFCRKYF